jgi:hypothetical protein
VRGRLPSGKVHDADDLDETRVRPPPVMPTPRPLVAIASPAKVSPPLGPPRTDRELLEALEAQRGRLTFVEARAFGKMLYDMHGGRLQALSYAQRAWAQEVGARLGLGVAKVEGWREVGKDLKRDP